MNENNDEHIEKMKEIFDGYPMLKKYMGELLKSTHFSVYPKNKSGEQMIVADSNWPLVSLTIRYHNV